MNRKQQVLTEHVGFRVSRDALEQIQRRAEGEGTIVSDWCRDRAIQAAKQNAFTSSEYALMAEISATEAILIDLLCAIGRDGKITQQKAQALVDAAHSAKYKEAAELLKYAYTQFQSGRLEAASDQGTADKR